MSEKTSLQMNEYNSGVAVGGASKSTSETEERFDCYNTPYFASIKNFRAGRTGKITAAANSVVDTTVTFSPAFPSYLTGDDILVFVNLYNGGTAYAYGNNNASIVTDSVTATGFKLRAYNASTSATEPYYEWIAFAHKNLLKREG